MNPHNCRSFNKRSEHLKLELEFPHIFESCCSIRHLTPVQKDVFFARGISFCSQDCRRMSDDQNKHMGTVLATYVLCNLCFDLRNMQSEVMVIGMPDLKLEEEKGGEGEEKWKEQERESDGRVGGSGFVLTPHKLAMCMLMHAYAAPSSATPPFCALPATCASSPRPLLASPFQGLPIIPVV